MATIAATDLPDLNQVFSLEGLRLLDIKTYLEHIMARLNGLDVRMTQVSDQFNNLEMPDVSKILAQLAELDYKVLEGQKERKLIASDLSGFKTQVNTSLVENKATS